MVERMNEEDDRRVKSLQLTTHGMKIMTTHRERRVARVRLLIATLPAETRMDILQALRQLLDTCTTVDSPIPVDTELVVRLEG